MVIGTSGSRIGTDRMFSRKKTDVTEKNGAARDGGGEVKGGAGGQEGGVFRSL